MRLRRKTPRQLQVERTLRALEDAVAVDLDGEAPLARLLESPVGELKVALVTDFVKPSDDASTIKRPTYMGYADAPAGLFGPAARGRTTNNNTLQFGACASGADVITGFAIYNDQTAEIIASAPLVPPTRIDPGLTPTFAPGAMTITLD